MKLSILLLTGLFTVSVNADETNALTTLSGTIYPSARVVRVDPDGLIIEYAPEPGASGLAKIKFTLLPEATQKQYGYDPQKPATAAPVYVAPASNPDNIRAWREYNNTVERRIVEAQDRAEEAAERQERLRQEAIAARQKFEDELRIQSVRAQQRAADAAVYEATRP